MKAFCVFLMLVGASASAFGGTPTLYQTYYDGPRSYYLYVPANGASSTVLWVMLHPTFIPPAGTTDLPTPFQQSQMITLADTNNIIVLWPISTFTPNNSYFWDPYFLCYFWMDQSLPCPNDSGYIRSLIVKEQTAYPSIKNVYVAGMSSGAFMAHRVGVDSADLVSAVGAASGQIYAYKAGSTNMMPQPSGPVAVLMLNGDADPKVDYCGETTMDGWGRSDFPSSDVSLDYWATSRNGCTQTSLPKLCNLSGPTTVNWVICGNVTFRREQGVGHMWVDGTEGVMWNFFQAHARP